MCLGKINEHAGNVSLVLDTITSFVLPKFHVVHDDDFTSVLIKIVDVLPPNCNELLKYHDCMSKEELIDTPLEATFKNTNDKIVKVKIRFDDASVTHPMHRTEDKNSSASVNAENEVISIDIDKETSELLSLSFDDSASSVSEIPSIQEEPVH